jgi:hypothetical protein
VLLVAVKPKGDISRQRFLSPAAASTSSALLLAREGLARRVWPADRGTGRSSAKSRQSCEKELWCLGKPRAFAPVQLPASPGALLVASALAHGSAKAPGSAWHWLTTVVLPTFRSHF